MEKKRVNRGIDLKLVIGVVLAASVIIGIAITSSNGKGTRPKTVKEGQSLSINDIQADPYAYKGTITITGVVADKSRYRIPKDIFLMVETSEAKICKQTGCAKFYLPVKYDGKHPEEWNEINVAGNFFEDEIVSGAEKRKVIFFAAKKVDVIRHLKF